METIMTILSLISLILIVISIILTNKLIDKFREENKDLRFDNEELSLQLDNTERRVVEHVRKIKKIEDIILDGNKANEFDTIILSKIKKELFTDANQEK